MRTHRVVWAQSNPARPWTSPWVGAAAVHTNPTRLNANTQAKTVPYGDTTRIFWAPQHCHVRHALRNTRAASQSSGLPVCGWQLLRTCCTKRTSSQPHRLATMLTAAASLATGCVPLKRVRVSMGWGRLEELQGGTSRAGKSDSSSRPSRHAVFVHAYRPRSPSSSSSMHHERMAHILSPEVLTHPCEGCLVVRSGHGPQAEVAQGVGPKLLVEH